MLQQTSGCDTGYECPGHCESDPCSCEELGSTCQVCHPNGCDQCINGYFKVDYDRPCVSCEEVFGESCLHCGDFTGCQQCAQGFLRIRDESCGPHFYYCAANTCPPTPHPTRMFMSNGCECFNQSHLINCCEYI